MAWLVACEAPRFTGDTPEDVARAVIGRAYREGYRNMLPSTCRYEKLPMSETVVRVRVVCQFLEEARPENRTVVPKQTFIRCYRAGDKWQGYTDGLHFGVAKKELAETPEEATCVAQLKERCPDCTDHDRLYHIYRDVLHVGMARTEVEQLLGVPSSSCQGLGYEGVVACYHSDPPEACRRCPRGPPEPTRWPPHQYYRPSIVPEARYLRPTIVPEGSYYCYPIRLEVWYSVSHHRDGSRQVVQSLQFHAFYPER